MQFCATIFVTVAIQPGFENNPNKMIMTRKIPACRILINKLIEMDFHFRIHAVTLEKFGRYYNFVRDKF